MKLLLVPIVAALVGIAAPGATAAPPQAGDATRVLADARAALGGPAKLDAVRTFAATGRATRVVDGASSDPADIETAFELPDKFMKKEALPLPMMAPGAITRTSGFNGDTPIEVVDRPPSMPGNVVIRMGPGDGPPGERTPEQVQEDRRRQVFAGKQELARLTLGFLASSLEAYPLQFSLAGQAESPDGKADVVEVKGEGDFSARLFIDASSHLPLMLSWMAKEPLVIRRMMGPAPGGGRGHASMPPPDAEKMRQGIEDERRQAEQNRRTVEFRVYYGDYREVSGVQVPFTIRRSIDGKPTEEVTFEKVKINAKIDPRKFEAK